MTRVMRQSSWRTAVLASLLLVVAATPAWAGSPTEQLREYSDQVIQALGNPALGIQDRRAAVRKIADGVFDVEEVARRALGRHWQERTPEERAEFSRLFVDLLQSTYIARIDQYGGERIRYVSETVDGDQAVVRAVVLTPQGSEMPVESRVLRRNGRWYIYDVSIEHVSLLASYRAQFDRIIRTGSFEELLRRLRQKREELLRSPLSTNAS